MMKFEPNNALVKTAHEQNWPVVFIEKEQFDEWFGGLSKGETLQEGCDRIFGQCTVTASDVQLKNLDRYKEYMTECFKQGRYCAMQHDVTMGTCDKRVREESDSEQLKMLVRKVRTKKAEE